MVSGGDGGREGRDGAREKGGRVCEGVGGEENVSYVASLEMDHT